MYFMLVSFYELMKYFWQMHKKSENFIIILDAVSSFFVAFFVAFLKNRCVYIH